MDSASKVDRLATIHRNLEVAVIDLVEKFMPEFNGLLEPISTQRFVMLVLAKLVGRFEVLLSIQGWDKNKRDQLVTGWRQAGFAGMLEPGVMKPKSLPADVLARLHAEAASWLEEVNEKEGD